MLANGGADLIIMGIFSVHPTGQISLFQNSLRTDETVPGLQRLTAAVHERGAKIGVQLFHGGREAKFAKMRGILSVSPFFVEDDRYYRGEYRALHEGEIWDIIQSFGDGARRAKDAGFDAIQVHGAHAYLLSEFLSPHTNRRKDKWDGDLKNRLRFHREIKREVEIPVMMVGDLRSLELMREIIQNGEADSISLSRPLIREPNLIDLWKRGDKKRPECVSCNRCLAAMFKGESLHCVLERMRALP